MWDHHMLLTRTKQCFKMICRSHSAKFPHTASTDDKYNTGCIVLSISICYVNLEDTALFP